MTQRITPVWVGWIPAVALMMAGCHAPPSPPPSVPVMNDSEIVFPITNRPDVRGTLGAVSSDHPLASAVGLEILRDGGTAVDAVVGMAAVLAVVRPHMNGVGGDAFAIFYDGETGRVTGMNGSGRAGALATPDFFGQRSRIPSDGALSVSVPGTVAAWADALDRFGTRSLAEVMGPAIRYAWEGFPVSTRLHSDLVGGVRGLNDHGRALYAPGGDVIASGELLKNPALAQTLEAIASGGKDAFYRGTVAEALADFIEREGGYLRASDFAAHETTWPDPLEGSYLGHRILVLPPNTQGIAQLQQMEMVKAFDLEAQGHNSVDYLHTLIEVKKLAFADRDRWVADPDFAPAPLARLLDPLYLRDRAGRVDAARAADDVASGVEGRAVTDDDRARRSDSGDTVYLTAVDRWGNAVSWIQSLFNTFGSGLLEPETGIVLQNRGALFSLDEDHPNVVAPGKRPYHTLTPTMGLRGSELAFTMGTPGGDSQTQSLLQIVNNMFIFGMTPQQAIEAPRFRSYNGLRVDIEDRVPARVLADLRARGHDMRVVHGWTATFGGAQMIYVEPTNGTLTAAADPRREAYALAY